MNFPEKLLSERRRLGLTQAKAAELLGISKSALEKWEGGTKTPKLLMQEGAIARLAKAEPSTKRRAIALNKGAVGVSTLEAKRENVMKTKKELTASSSRMTVQRCRKNNSRYGEIHFAHHEFETLCGVTANSNWWILTNRHDGDATCAKCIKTNAEAYTALERIRREIEDDIFLSQENAKSAGTDASENTL